MRDREDSILKIVGYFAVALMCAGYLVWRFWP